MRGEQGDTELWGRCRRRLWDDEAVPGRLQRFSGGSGSETDALTHPHPVCCRRLLGAGGSLGAGPGEETQLALLCTSLLPKRPPPTTTTTADNAGGPESSRTPASLVNSQEGDSTR